MSGGKNWPEGFLKISDTMVGYDNRIRVKYTAKWGVQIAGMIFQTCSSFRAADKNQLS